MLFRMLFKLLIFPGILFWIGLAFFSEWILRKTVAKIQTRYGPLLTGKIGILQPFADFVKLLSKEDVTHKDVDKFLFTALPVIAVIVPLFALSFIPINSLILGFEGDLFLIFFLITVQAFVLSLSGHASRDRFSTIGGMRTILLLVAFDIPLFLSLIGPAIQADSLSINAISQNCYIFTQPLGFAIFLLCSLAELELIPFDIPEAESEIVAGWLTEFSGKKLAFFRLSHNLELILMSSLGTSLFLGGSGSLGLMGFLIKTISLVFLFSMLTALSGRFRIDQAVRGSWKYLLPLSLLQILIIMVI